jgi:hypothetical protein
MSGRFPVGYPSANFTPASSTRTKVLKVGGAQTSLKAIRDLNCRWATSCGGSLLAPIIQVDQLPPIGLEYGVRG